MINWETIKSLYNDKPTLMEWLKKVEAALNGATLTSVSVNTISVGVISLTFEFDDGTSITTPNINLPQGAQGVSITGASIVAGKLILTLSNGTAIDAGNTGAVLGFEIDNSQHLIVKYQDGTSEDLGAIFTGNVSITGNFAAGGDIKPLENIVDSAAHKRFREWDGVSSTISGLTITYRKASLSGTHIMFVVAGSVETGTTLTNGTSIARFTIPQWILDKIIPTWASTYIEAKSTYAYASDWTTQTLDFALAKSGSNIDIVKLGNIALNADRSFRIQFDLVIDLS